MTTATAAVINIIIIIIIITTTTWIGNRAGGAVGSTSIRRRKWVGCHVTRSRLWLCVRVILLVRGYTIGDRIIRIIAATAVGVSCSSLVRIGVSHTTIAGGSYTIAITIAITTDFALLLAEHEAQDALLQSVLLTRGVGVRLGVGCGMVER